MALAPDDSESARHLAGGGTSNVSIPTAVAVRLSLSLLEHRARLHYLAVVMVQMLTAFLDLAGVLLLGCTGLFLVSASDSQATLPPALTSALEALGLASVDLGTLAIACAAVAAVFFVMKSVLSLSLIKWQLFFLSRRQVDLAHRLTSQLLTRPLLQVQDRPSQETAYAISAGTIAAVIGVLGSAAIVLTESALLLLLTIALLFVDAWVTLVACVAFLATAGLLHKWTSKRALAAGRAYGRAQLVAYQRVEESIASLRHIVASNRRTYFRDGIVSQVNEASRAQASLNYFGQLPKYVYENVLILGALSLATAQMLFNDTAQAVAVLSLFLASGTRVMPSLLRLQNAITSIRGSAGAAEPTYELASSLDRSAAFPYADHPGLWRAQSAGNSHTGFVPSVSIERLTIAYPDSASPALQSVDLTISPGQSVAIVGPTGSGKSTLVDALLGLLTPESGCVAISGVEPLAATVLWPGAMAYVPQTVRLISGTVRENVALGLEPGSVSDESIWIALERAHLDEVIRGRRHGLDTSVGEDGFRLSGGQRQRMGIARALLSEPKLLVLDEATSALDAETEEAIASTLRELRGTITTVSVAHRLATVVNADAVVYLEGGRVEAIGTFSEVRSRVPSLELQAQILGL